jgi:hypothetical protein
MFIMRSIAFSATAILSAWVLCLQPAVVSATNRVLTGTLTSVLVQTNLQVLPGTVTFHMSVVPSATGCPLNNGIFAFSATSVTDSDSRKGMLAVLLIAQAQGGPVTVVYDDAGAFCDPLGYAVPIALGPAS